MYHFTASPNSRYFIYQIDRDIHFTRGDRVLWTKSVSQDDYRILGIGNNGSIAVSFSEGVQLYGITEQDPVIYIETFSKKHLSERCALLKKVYFNNNGTQLCVDRVSEESKLAGKLFSALAAVPSEKNLIQHEILFYSLDEKTYMSYYKTQHQKEMDDRFIWNISSDFCYIIIGEPQKAGKAVRQKFQIVHVKSYEAYYEFIIPETQKATSVLINNLGTALLEVSTDDGTEIHIISQDGQKHVIRPPAGDYRIQHLGKAYVAFQTSAPPAIVVKSFEDILLCHADFSSLDVLGIPYSLVYNEKDEIDILYILEGEPKVLNSDIERVTTDARRWELLAKEVTGGTQDEQPRVVEKERKTISMDFITERKRKAAADQNPEAQESRAAMTAIVPKPRMTEMPMFRDRGEAEKNLENLKLQFIIGQISLEHYNSAKEMMEKDLALHPGAPEPVIRKEPPQAAGGEEIAKVEKLLARLEERFILGEISEESYKELQAKYSDKLKSLKS